LGGVRRKLQSSKKRALGVQKRKKYPKTRGEKRPGNEKKGGESKGGKKNKYREKSGN